MILAGAAPAGFAGGERPAGSVLAGEEFADPRADRPAVVAVHHGSGHPDRVAEEEVPVQRLAAGESGNRGIEGQNSQTRSGPGTVLPCRYMSMSARASLLTSASPGSAIRPEAQNLRMMAGKRPAEVAVALAAGAARIGGQLG